jgi:alpha-beta hydrolase superfamily lysophospholipase
MRRKQNPKALLQNNKNQAELLQRSRSGALLVFFVAIAVLNAFDETKAAGFDTALVRRSLRPLSLAGPTHYPQDVLDYFHYYGLDHPATPHYFGTFCSGPYICAAHIYKQDSARGTVFLVHGYYDHTGILKNLISLFLDEKFCVAALDLPGHGLSSGEPASIDSFEEYSAAFRDFLAQTAPSLPKPFFACGHSTGCAVILDFLFKGNAVPFRDVILMAPLIRSEYWYLSKAAYTITKPFFPMMPRWLRRASADTAFLSWFARDPLQVQHFPVRWGTALYAWENRIDTVKPQHFPVTIIQGTEDNTVDWLYNVPFLEEKIPGCSVVYIKNGRHQLMNESEPLRKQTLDCIRKILDRK